MQWHGFNPGPAPLRQPTTGGVTLLPAISEVAVAVVATGGHAAASWLLWPCQGLLD